VIYTSIDRYENLIFYANSLKTTKEKIMVLSRYFLNNVNVDYIKLQAKKIINSTKNFDDSTEQRFDFSSPEGIDEALAKLKEKQEISPQLEWLLKRGAGKPYETPKMKPFILGEKPEIDHYETCYTNFVEVAQEIERKPSDYCNGLIMNGNCDVFSIFAKEVMDDLGIENHLVDGKGEIDHIWNMYKDEESGEWKHFDMTYLIYARDGKKIAGEVTPLEWAQATTERLFEMQPTRTITAVDDIKLSTSITAENCSSFVEEVAKILSNVDKKKA